MKTLLRFFTLLLISVVLVSCGEVTIELDTPMNVLIQDGIVTWDEVTDATEYVVVIDDEEFSVVITTFDLATLDLLPGSFTIHVIAKSGAVVSLPSSTVSYSILSADASLIYSAVLTVLDDDFVPDMGIGEFADADEYEDYLAQAKFALSFSEAVAALGLSEEEAIALFNQLHSYSDQMNSPNTIAGLMIEIDSFAVYGIDSDDLAYLLLNLALTAIEIRDTEIDNRLIDGQAHLIVLESDLAAARANTVDAVYALLLVHATPEQAVLLEEFFKGEHSITQHVIWVIEDIARDLKYNPENHDPFYLDDNDPYIQLFYDILNQALAQGDTALLDSILTYGQFDNLLSVHYSYMLVYWLQSDIDELIEEQLQLEELSALFTAQQDMMLESMELVIDYLSAVYDSLPSSLISLLDDANAGKELTTAEYLIIKDEITTILLATLPSAQDFAQLYTIIFTISSILSDSDLDAHLAYADFYGEVNHATLDLALTFIAGIDQATITDIQLLAESILIVETDTYDYEKIIELTVYVGTYFQNFKSDNAAKFLVLETLLNDDQLEALFTMLANSLKESMELELHPDDFEMFEFIIDEVVADYDVIREGLDIVHDLGLDVVQEFLSTQGQIFIDIIALSEFTGSEPDQVFIADLEIIITQALSYNSTIFDNMDAATIEKLLGLIRIPLMIELALEGDMTFEEFELLFDDIATPVSIVLANTITLQKQFVLALDALDFETLLYDSSWNIAGEDAYMALFIMAIVDTYTPEMILLMAATSNIVSNDILKNAILLDMMDMTSLQVDLMINTIQLEVTAMILEATAIAAFDYTSITPLELLRIQVFMETYFPSNPEAMPYPAI